MIVSIRIRKGVVGIRSETRSPFNKESGNRRGGEGGENVVQQGRKHKSTYERFARDGLLLTLRLTLVLWLELPRRPYAPEYMRRRRHPRFAGKCSAFGRGLVAKDTLRTRGGYLDPL